MLARLLAAIGRLFRDAARGLVLLVDFLQRRFLGIVEFSQDPDCIARIARSTCRAPITLPDGTHVNPGETMGDIHLWNERAPEVPPSGPNLAWALGLRRKIIRSLRELAAYVDQAPEYAGVRVFRGGTSFTRRGGLGEALTGGDLAARLGFHVVQAGPAQGSGTPSSPRTQGIAGLARRFRDFSENLYYLALVWAFNPRSLRTKGLAGLARVELYMTRATLMDRYGSAPASRTVSSRE